MYRAGDVSRIVTCLTAAAAALALAAVLGAASAGGRDEELFIRPEDQRIVGFASVDLGRSAFVSGGTKQAVTGSLDRTGFVAIESGGFGLTRERLPGSPEVAVTRLKTEAALLAGFQSVVPSLYLAGFIGPELEHEQLTIGGTIFRFSKPRYGVQGQAELWSNPTADTLVTGTVVAGSARLSLWARASAGIRVAGRFFVGPEVTAYSTETYRETRIGAHLTGFAIGIVQGRVSAGWMMTDDGRRGTPYLGLTGWIRM